MFGATLVRCKTKFPTLLTFFTRCCTQGEHIGGAFQIQHPCFPKPNPTQPQPQPPCAALAKYGKGQETDDVVEAVESLIKRNIVANQPPAAAMTSNQFRNERLYNEEVDVCLKKNQNMLKALYSRCGSLDFSFVMGEDGVIGSRIPCMLTLASEDGKKSLSDRNGKEDSKREPDYTGAASEYQRHSASATSLMAERMQL